MNKMLVAVFALFLTLTEMVFKIAKMLVQLNLD